MGTKIAEKIRAERVRRGMTQADLGERLRVAANTVARWERDEMEPTGLYLDSILKWLSEDLHE